MNAKRLASGIVVTGILGVALLEGIGPHAATAEAGPKREKVTQRDHRKQAVVRQDQKRDAVRQRRTDAVRDRRVDVRRDVDVRHRSVDVRHRDVDVRHRRADTDRYYGNDRRVVRHRAPVRVYSRPWYRTAPLFYVDRSPFYFHAGLGIYLGGVLLNLELTDAAPAGYVYVDPFCDVEFWTIEAYRLHLHRHHHRPALRLVEVGYCGY
jgi:hypothetical protein